MMEVAMDHFNGTQEYFAGDLRMRRQNLFADLLLSVKESA